MTEKEYLELADLLYPQVVDTAFYFNKYNPRNVQGRAGAERVWKMESRKGGK